MSDYSFWSLIPPLLAIILAIMTRQVFLSLGVGILSGGIILENGNIFAGCIRSIDLVTGIFTKTGSTETIIFTMLMGVLIAFIQRSGGVSGFNNMISSRLDSGKKSARKVQLWAAFTGLAVFVESNISALTVGTLYRPLTDRLGISREKLAYIADSTSAPSSILIPLNAWGGFIMGLLVIQGIDNPFKTLVTAIPYNFYPILTVMLLFSLIISGKNFGPMAISERRARNEGKPLRDGATPAVSAEVTMMDPAPGVPLRFINMLLPLGIMILSLPLMLIISGWDSLPSTSGSFAQNAARAIGLASGSSAVLYSVLLAVVITALAYRVQKIMSIKNMVSLSMQGMGGMVPMALLMVMAFATGDLCNELGTGPWVARVTESWLSPGYIPLVLFITSCFIAFSTGTSWGTFAIMVAIAVPVANSMGTDLHLALAAALGGGVFGDHCSPISDTTLISSMASASDHIDHVRTQLPYAITAGVASAIIYLVLGLMT